MNYTQLIDDRLEPESRLREFAGAILREGERVAEIVRNLLNFSRQEKQAHSPASLAAIVKDTVALIRTIVRGDQIRIRNILESSVSTPEPLP